MRESASCRKASAIDAQHTGTVIAQFSTTRKPRRRSVPMRALYGTHPRLVIQTAPKRPRPERTGKGVSSSEADRCDGGGCRGDRGARRLAGVGSAQTDGGGGRLVQADQGR